MSAVSYDLTVGNWSVSSANDPRTELLEVETQLYLDSPCDTARVSVYAPPPAKPGLLAQAAGEAAAAAGSALGLSGGGAAAPPAFSIEVRGKKVQLGDTMTIKLGADGNPATVLTGDIVPIETSLGRLTVTGRTGMQKLAESRVNQVYENRTLGQIVKDLCSQASVSAGDVDDGSKYPYVVAHETKSVLRTIRELASREGLDMYFDTDNKLNVKEFTKTSPDHTLYYGIDLLDAAFLNGDPTSEHVVVYGESPSSSQGSDTWSWLTKDRAPALGDVGNGARLTPLSDGALRSQDAAGTAAAARLGGMKDSATAGRIVMLGHPQINVADAVELKNVPRPEMNGLFKVVAVRHRYSKRSGYLTELTLTGHGGAAAAKGLLGQAAGGLGAAAGALGL
jgi:phage protein D